MKGRKLVTALASCVVLLSLADKAQAQLLGVDFQNTTTTSAGVTQAGFVAFDNRHSAGGSGAASYGQYNVALTGMDTLLEGVFTRGGVSNGGGLTNADIYNDFAFNNFDGTMKLTLAGSGIRPNTKYDLTFYSYDNVADSGHTHTVNFAATSGTTGSTVSIATVPDVDPTTNGQYSTTGSFTSNGSGVLTIDISDVTPNHSNWGPRLNAVAINGPAAPNVGAPILRVDFDDGAPGVGPTQAGFENYAEVGSPGTRTYSTSAGTLDVTVSGHQTGVVGGFFDRGAPADSGGFTFGNLYRDYAFRNDNGTIEIEIEGLQANTDYEITWYVYDRNNGDTPFGTISPDDLGNTIGDVLTTFYDGNFNPTSNDQYAFTGIWSSSDTSLEFDITGTSGNRVRVNGFELRPVLVEAVPEPASIALWSLLGIVLAGYGFLRTQKQ